MMLKENKFMVGEEEEEENSSKKNARSTTPTTTKRPVRHHVKRRSSGKIVHVTKLTSMAKAHHHTDSEADQHEETHRPLIKRSQSQRSLHRISADKKSFVPKEINKKADLTMSSSTPQLQQKKTSIPPLTCKAMADPIQQPLNALANNLSVPKLHSTHLMPIISPAAPAPVPPSISQEIKPASQKQLLRSQFIHEDPLRSQSNMSRTQQKLMLQKQQCSVQDETSPFHPRNIQKLNKELDAISRQYRCIKRYQDPLRASIARCVEKIEPNSGIEHTNSSIPHFEHRQIAHRHHLLKEVALSRQQTPHTTYPLPHAPPKEYPAESHRFPWSAAAFLDKLFHPTFISSSPT